MEETIENAKITKVSITMADHGCVTFWVFVEGKGWGCGIGGYCIGHGYLGAKKFDGSGDGIEAMARIMDVVGVEKWEDLTGKYCRVQMGNSWDGIHTIGNVIEDKWFDLKAFFAARSAENGT